MPRSRSSGALSIWSYAVKVAPPVSARTLVIAAVSDVLPWSTCPIVPMLQCGLFRSNFALPIVLSVDPAADLLSFKVCLPAVVAECLVSFRHPVGIFTLFDRCAAVVHRVQQLVRKPVLHRVLTALTGRVDDPANGQGLPAFRTHFDRHLIGGAPNAARANLDSRLHVVQRLMEHTHRIGGSPTPAL